MTTRRILLQIIVSLLLGVLIAWGMNEISFIFLRTEATRGPETIELVIPDGTALRVERGESEPSIPKGMVFVVGDTLIVRNLDTVAHQLGPLFIPSGTSANLNFKVAEKYEYSCSFIPDNSFGLDVQLPVTSLTRFTGAVFAGLPLGGLIAMYSLVISFSRSKKPG